MPTLVIKSNVSRGTLVLIKDMGIEIPPSGGSITLVEFDEILLAQESTDLRDYLTDNFYGASDSTLILNDGTGDIDQADAFNFLATVLLPAGDADYGVVKTNADGEIETDLTWDGAATVNGVLLGTNMAAGGFKITGLAVGTAPTDSINKSQLDSLAATQKVWKELALHADQFDSINDALSQAIPFFLDGNPSDTDTFIVTDGATTETFTFKTTPAGAFDVQIGVDADTTMANLVAQINADSTLWSASLSTTLESINDGSGSSTTGTVVVIYRTDNSATDSYADRIYGVLTTQAFGQYVNYNGELDYELSTNTALGTTDPTQKEFGFGRATSSLIPNETHAERSTDFQYTWDSDDTVWQNTGTNAIIAGAGLTKSGGTIDVGAGNGIIVNADDVEVDYGEVGDIASLGGTIAAGVLNEAARADHVHTHGDRGPDGAVSQHDAQQIDVTGTYSNIGAPNDAETVFSNINTLLGASRGSKWLQFSFDKGVQAPGTQYLGVGTVLTSAAEARMLRAGTITGASVQLDAPVNGTRAYKLSIQVNGSEVALLAVGAAALGASTTALSASYAANDLVRVAMIRTTGAGKSDFNDINAIVEFLDT